MTDYVLLDANLIIYAFDSTATKENKDKAKNMLKKYLRNNDVVFAITPLIRYEVLRHPCFTDCNRYQKLESILNSYEVFDIDEKTTSLAISLYRYDVYTAKNANKNFEKRKFDTFHFATAKCNELDISSFDDHMDDIETLYQKYLVEINNSK